MGWIPAGFREACAYYRKAYERFYALDLAASMVVESRRHYAEETVFPVLQHSLCSLKGS